MLINFSNRLETFPLTRLNGPGLRFSIFVQGCPLRCTNECLNEEALSMAPRVLRAVDDVLAHVLHLHRIYGIEGVTLLGGEPFGQALALSELAEQLQEHGLSVMTYTGYTLPHLIHTKNIGYQKLLKATDILVEGPYRAEFHSAHLLWRGSANQRILLFSRCYTCDQLTNHYLFSPEQRTSPHLQVYEPYFENIELHWSQLVKLTTCDQHHADPLLSEHQIHQWCPECEAIRAGRTHVEKGIIALIQDEQVALYGYQEKQAIRDLAAALEPLHIHLPVESL